MILLDTDHITILLFENHAQFDGLSRRLLDSTDQHIGSTAISLEEQMRGWLAEIKRRKRIHDLVPIYSQLTRLVEFYSGWELQPFDKTAADIFVRLREQKVRIATQDLKIASIALATNSLLLSANLVHFQQVPSLKVEDWLHG